MKEWKKEFVSSCIRACSECRIVRIRDVAATAGMNHICRGDTVDILTSLKKAEAEGKLPDGYHIAIDGDITPTNSLFQALCLVDEATGLLQEAEPDRK